MAPGSVELMDVEINKTLNESYKRAQTILKTHRFNLFYIKRNHYIHNTYMYKSNTVYNLRI